MGASVSAECECGFKAELLVGGGMQTFMTTCYFPGLCRSCHSIVELNLLGADQRCPACEGLGVIPYDSASIAHSAGTRVVVAWNADQLGSTLQLTDGSYECPKCGKISLRFSEGGVLWD